MLGANGFTIGADDPIPRRPDNTRNPESHRRCRRVQGRLARTQHRGTGPALGIAPGYVALRQTQGAIGTESANWQPWLIFFLRALAEQVRRLHRKVEWEKIVLATLPELASQIVEFVQDHGGITMGEAIRLTGGNRIRSSSTF